jgi:anti-sigma factor RsiW
MNSHAHSRCRDLMMRLSMYLDDELKPADRRAVTTHIRRCPCCEWFAESLRRTSLVCRRAGNRRLPPALRERARMRVARLLDEAASNRS